MRNEIQKLVDRWTNDTAFRTALRGNPEEAIRKTGIQLTPDEWSAFRKIDWKLSDTELKARVIKAA